MFALDLPLSDTNEYVQYRLHGEKIDLSFNYH